MPEQYLYETAVLDPPWPYNRVSGDKRLNGYVNQTGNDQYPTLSIGAMKNLPIGDLVGGYVFMWTCGPFLQDGLDMLKAWGFDYVTQVAWHKSTGIGVGYWFRGDHELVLVGRRKGYPSIRTKERSLFSSPRQRHSQKPENIHRIAEKHFPGPYLEVFGRRPVSGWTVVGNEAPGYEGQDIRESLSTLLAGGQ